MTQINYPFYLLRTTSDESLIVLDIDSMTITNRIYHDANYSYICFNPIGNTIIAADYAGYLITMVFHEGYGDMEEEGVAYKKPRVKNELPGLSRLGSKLSNK